MEIAYSVFDFAVSISEATDLVAPDLNTHHKKVCYISYMIAKEMMLPDDEIRDIALGAVLHDIGAFTRKGRIKLISSPDSFEDDEHDQHDQHQFIGYKLLRDFAPFGNAAALIRYHHTHFDEAANEIPMGSYVIHLADRIAVLLDKRREVLAQIPGIMNTIEENRAIFHPEGVDIFYW